MLQPTGSPFFAECCDSCLVADTRGSEDLPNNLERELANSLNVLLNMGEGYVCVCVCIYEKRRRDLGVLYLQHSCLVPCLLKKTPWLCVASYYCLRQEGKASGPGCARLRTGQSLNGLREQVYINGLIQCCVTPGEKWDLRECFAILSAGPFKISEGKTSASCRTRNNVGTPKLPSYSTETKQIIPSIAD